MGSTRPKDRGPFLTAKLAVPGALPRSVNRPRLLELLDAGSDTPLTLVSAPAGWGKTALVAAWVHEGRAPGDVAWLSLASEDDERRRFWTAAVAALSAAARPLESLSLPPRARLDGFLRTLVEVLGKLRRPLTLVLDDFHEIHQTTISADLEGLLEHAPQRLRLVVCTRLDPPFRLERLRLAGKLTEVRARDLAFTPDETTDLARELELAISPEDAEVFWRRTEGWAAGLRLAALSLRGNPDPHGFLNDFAGDDRAVSDYLTAEVISRQPPDTLDFMLRTSIVDRLDGDLADALTGATGGGRTLAELVHRDGLLDRIDGRGAWYRYHPLFADVLRAELRRTLPDQVAELHHRAGRWHADHGEPLEGVRHAVAGSDWPLAAEVVGEHWLGLLTRGHGALLGELIRPIPDDVVRSHPELALARAGLRLEAGDGTRSEELLARARELAPTLPEPRRRRLLLTAIATDLFRARISGDLEQAAGSAASTLEEEWERDVVDDVRALTLANLGIAEFWSDRLPEAERHLQEAAGLARTCENDYVLFVSQGYAAAVACQTGRIDEARRRGHAAIALAVERGWGSISQAAIAYLSLASVHVFRSELDAAEELMGKARAALHLSGERLVRLALAQLEARLLITRGEAPTALELLRGAASAAEPVPRFLRVWGGMLEADLLLAVGEAARARKLLRDLDATETAPDAAVGLARLELAAGDPGAAIRSVATFLADGREAVQPNARVEAWVIDAIARDEIRNEQGALRALERALDLAEPRDFRSPFIRYGAPVRSLLRRRIETGTTHRAFAGELLVTLHDEISGGRPPGRPLFEPLSERELGVLRFLPTVLSNAEIAAEMSISVNTVKTHLRNLYRKLEVTGRRDAVDRARELGLLSPGLRDH